MFQQEHDYLYDAQYKLHKVKLNIILDINKNIHRVQKFTMFYVGCKEHRRFCIFDDFLL